MRKARIIAGKMYLTPQGVADRLGVNRRTVLRWFEENPVHEILKNVKWFRDPLSGYIYVEENSVSCLVKEIVGNKK